MKEQYYTKGELIESTQEIDEGLLSIENALLVAGFVPVIGEIADTILIIKYLREKRYIEAGLMVFALIPTVGDMAVKPLLMMGRGAKAFASTSKFAGFLAKNPKAAKLYQSIFPHMNSPQISKLIGQVGKISPRAAKQMKAGVDFHITRGGKLVMGAQKNILGKPKFGPGYKMVQRSRTNALQKHLVKTGTIKNPEKFLTGWWNVTYKGSRNRKKLIHKILLGSNLLASLGIISIQDFERRMSDPVEAQKLVNDPKFQEFYSQASAVQGEQPQQNSSGGGAIKGALSMDILKSLATKLII